MLGPIGRHAALEQIRIEAQFLSVAGLEEASLERQSLLHWAELEDATLRRAGQ
jgi:hypothetical protein